MTEPVFEWIPYTKQKPTPGQHCILHYADDTIRYGFYEPSRMGGFVCKNRTYCVSADAPTHWVVAPKMLTKEDP